MNDKLISGYAHYATVSDMEEASGAVPAISPTIISAFSFATAVSAGSVTIRRGC